MTSLVPREPYSAEELAQLYPKDLKLQLVQVFLRHGERTPVSSRFQNTGLAPYWPYCNVARRMIQMAASRQDLSSWDGFQWRRRLERFGPDDEAVVAVGAGDEIEGICQHGELTDKGRQSTFALGQRLRHLYVDQLGFMPKIKSDTEDMYLRTTPIPRALESLQQAFWGMYPPSARTANFPPPVIVARSVSEETLFPNEGGCRRFRQLGRLFAQRAADRWNKSEQMDYLNSLWSKWMPESSPRVAVDSHPRLSGIMDTVNASDAHGNATRLPSEFYDKKAREIMDEIAVEEWFAGYHESREYRRLGIGALLGDVVDRMVSAAVDGGWRSETTATTSLENKLGVSSSGSQEGGGGGGGGGKAIKMAMSGCHDTTLAAILTSVGAFQDAKWPPFTSSIAIELFSKETNDSENGPDRTSNLPGLKKHAGRDTSSSSTGGFLSYLIGKSGNGNGNGNGNKNGNGTRTDTSNPTSDTARVPLSSLPPSARQSLRRHYVRIRYNDRPVRIPGCAAKPENHLPDDETFCTLDAFKEIVDKFTPRNWQEECMQNVGEGLFGKDETEKADAGF